MIENVDFLVIGGGLAGMSFALDAAQWGKVAIYVKKGDHDANTFYAQGGIASVTSEEDSFSRHIEDTLNAGAGLCNPEIVRITVEEGPDAIHWLRDRGVEFSRRADGTNTFDLGKEGGHTKRRVLHSGDITGRAIQLALLEKVRSHPNIEYFERHMAIDLIMKHKITGDSRDRKCLGAYVFDEEKGEVKAVVAPVTLLATGGAGKVYLYTSNPDVSTGDGVAIAHRAGARVGNMEFIQFHPTCLFHPKAKSFLISEALRGEGGILKTISGESFMDRYHEMGSLAPRDVVAHAIDIELKRSGDEHVVLDMTHLDADFLVHRFPNIHAECLNWGVDMTVDPIPVVPAAHYSCGGVLVDEYGHSSVAGLYVVGEAACTGLHGANRLASNSLLEAVVFARRAAVHAHREYTSVCEAWSKHQVPIWDKGKAVPSDERVVISHIWDEIRRFMWNYVGISRTVERLRRAKSRIDLVRGEIDSYYWKYTIDSDLLEVRNIAVVSDLIISSAMNRMESRGLHCLLDFPDRDDERFLRPTIL